MREEVEGEVYAGMSDKFGVAERGNVVKRESVVVVVLRVDAFGDC